MHQIQKTLLKRLVDKNGQPYSTLTRGYDFENNIVFHLKQLISSKFITKADNLYKITAKGIKDIYSLGLPDLDNPEKKTFYCGFVIVDKNNNYLIKGHPNTEDNFFNLPSDRPRFGENMGQAIVRLVLQNTNLKIDPKRFNFLSLHVKIVKTKDNEIIFDDGQVIFKTQVSDIEKRKMKLLKNISWMNINEIKHLPCCWPEIKLCILDKKTLPYASYQIVSSYKL